MIVLAQPLRLSPEQFEELPDSQGLELIDGIVREKNMGTESGSINARISYYLNRIVIPGNLGAILDSEGMYRCFPSHPGRVRKPDVSFIRRERLPGGLVPIGITTIAPDLAIEVISPNDGYEEVDEKVADYFDAKIPLIWVVAPRTQTVLVYRHGGLSRRYSAAEELDADPVIPGFRVMVADFFPNPAILPETLPDE